MLSRILNYSLIFINQCKFPILLYNNIMTKLQNRLEYMDITKGIGIIMIVWAHTHGIFSTFCITFAIPLFFFVSGYFHNKSINFLEFFKRKFFRLYLPFIMCNLIFPTIVLLKRLSLHLEIKNNIFYILQIFLTLKKDGFLFGATWFLASLFLISISIKFLEIILKSDKKYLIIFLITLIISIIAGTNFPSLDTGIRRTLMLPVFYALGLNYKEYFNSFNKIKLLPILLGLTALTIIYSNINLGFLFSYDKSALHTLLLFVICSSLFTFAIIKLSKYICNLKSIAKILSTTGFYSIHILIWHFVFFEIISGIILLLNGISLYNLQILPHVLITKPIISLIYFFTGIIGSLAVGYCFEKIKNIINTNKKD